MSITKICSVCGGVNTTAAGKICHTCRRNLARKKNGLPCNGDTGSCDRCNVEFVYDRRTIQNLGRAGRNICSPCIDEVYKETRTNNKKSSVEKFRHIARAAVDRGIEVTISLDYYKENLMDKPCHYCGEVVIHTGSGVDRIDSDKGYIEGNVVPCCPTCNVMKNVMSESDMLNHMLKVLKHKGVV